MTRRILFYGCSYTAGDELADNEFFPWIKYVRTQEEYVVRKQESLLKMRAEDMEKYYYSCRQKAYPQLMNTDEINTVNRALCGSSVEEQVFYILKDYEQGWMDSDSTVYLQLIGYPREIYLEEDRPRSLRFSDIKKYSWWDSDAVNEYKLAKLNTHGLDHWVAMDYMLIITTKNFLNNKQIPFYLINLDDALENRNNELNRPIHTTIRQLFEKEIKVLDLQDLIDPETKLINGHFNHQSHKRIAELVTEHYWQNTP